MPATVGGRFIYLRLMDISRGRCRTHRLASRSVTAMSYERDDRKMAETLWAAPRRPNRALGIRPHSGEPAQRAWTVPKLRCEAGQDLDRRVGCD